MLNIDTQDLLHLSLISVLEMAGILANITLIAAIRRRTPKSLATYAVVLLAMAYVDLTTAIASWMTAARLQNDNMAMILIYIGPCTMMGAQWCHSFVSLHTGTVGQSIVLLLVSFAYRLWILRNSAQRSVIDHLAPRLTSLTLLALYGSGFVAVVVMRRKLLKTIGHLARDRWSILWTLTIQMLLPLTYVVAALSWMADVVGIIESTTVRRLVMVMSSVFALVTPLVNLYYLRPYRRFVMELLGACTKSQDAVITINEFH